MFAVRWFIIVMSAEKISSTGVSDLPTLETPINSEEISSSGRVDINVLLDRVRETKKKENKTNLVLFGLFALIICVVGIILSF